MSIKHYSIYYKFWPGWPQVKVFSVFSQCVAWYPKSEPENLLAVGQANGRVLVTR